MILPLRQAALRERELLDREEEVGLASDETPDERLELAFEMNDLVFAIGEAADAAWLEPGADDLADKAARYARPLRVAATS